MKGYRRMVWGAVLVMAIFIAAQSQGSAVAAETKLEVVPDKTALSPDLVKNPVQFKGSGFAAKEMVTVEMVLPSGVKVKTVPEGEKVGLAFGQADEKGNFEAKMAPTATLNWFFQVGWTPEGQPNLKEATPLPPGKYKIEASGMASGKVGKAALELLKPPPPPEKKEKK